MVPDQQREAARIAREALSIGSAMIAPGTAIRTVLEAVEAHIADSGAAPAFPAQSSRNDIAAHYCSSPTDETLYEDGDLVKIDVGVHVEGWVADTATTVDLGTDGQNGRISEAAKAALDAAIDLVRPGCRVFDIGAKVQEVIESYGCRPVRNLTGHGIGHWQIHTSPQIPNVPDGHEILREGQVIAIEPFATDGEGVILERGRAEVFMMMAAPTRTRKIDSQVLADIEAMNGLPFARRSLAGHSEEGIENALKRLSRQGAMMRFPPLVERAGGQVAQHEHTLHVTASGADVLTA